MRSGTTPIQYLISLPPGISELFGELEGLEPPQWFCSHDPAGRPLGSGGGTANLLAEAWNRTGRANQAARQPETGGRSFTEWLKDSRKLIIHAGGQSRRLPAYATTGKLLIPMPVLRSERGQRLDQTLLDLQVAGNEQIFSRATPRHVVMIASGDVLITFPPELPQFPDVDVVGLGLWGNAEFASHHGVFFMSRTAANDLAFFKQKPSIDTTQKLARDYHFLVDSGMWLLSERAVVVLMEHCGWQPDPQQFAGGQCEPYELYSHFAMALGRQPEICDKAIGELSCAVVALPPTTCFRHLGTSEQIIDSVADLQASALAQTHAQSRSAWHHPDIINQNSDLQITRRPDANYRLWVENSYVPESWRMAAHHVITGVPPNDWGLQLESGTCLDVVPVGDADFCIRAYGLRDPFRGRMGDPGTMWLGRPVTEWFQSRGLDLHKLTGSDSDIQDAPLFPRLAPGELSGAFVQWLLDAKPQPNAAFASLYEKCTRLSASQLMAAANLRRLYAQRAELRRACMDRMMQSPQSVFFQLDLESTARDYARTESVPPLQFAPQEDTMEAVHGRMFESAVLRCRSDDRWPAAEAEAFAILRRIILRETQLSLAQPRRSVLLDQIVWARSPVRFDLAGGWTDTPPFCIEYGGRVLNVAADLNGQPPIQVFAKLCDRPELVLHSIDLGISERITTYAELDTYADPRSPFALAKAAFALAGFLPRFHASGGAPSLQKQLEEFGGGIELSLLSAVPKGSGLGTSSIIAATALAALSDLCGLSWDRNTLFSRTLALEQMLTTGGGWQDQAGAIFRGIKCIETAAGLAQTPALRWLPDHLFGHEYANRSILLFYTGLTRLAKNILAEIVRGFFLNSPRHLNIVHDINANVDVAANAIQRCDYAELCAAIHNSWVLNQRLDSGTNPPEVRQILESIKDYLAASKLLGAGGGGYLLMFAKDETAAGHIKRILTNQPPNPRSRFVQFAVSDTGLQVTRS